MPSRSGVPGRDESQRAVEGFRSGRRQPLLQIERPGTFVRGHARVPSGTRLSPHGAGVSSTVTDAARASRERVRTSSTRTSIDARARRGSTAARSRGGTRAARASASRRGALRDLPHLAAEADLAEHDRVGVRRGCRRARRRSPSATARSAPGSTTRTPPATLAYTSAAAIRHRRARCSTATSIASRLAVDRLRDPARHRRRACRRRAPAPRRTADARPRAPARRPSPNCPARRSARNNALGVGDRLQARRRVISIRPSSSVGPKRCLSARSMRSAWWRSPSNESTVSTTCSSARGPASAPSLVTWPTSIVAMPVVLREPHQPLRAVAHLARPSPAAPGASGSCTAWIESIARTSGRSVVDVRARRPAATSRRRGTAVGASVPSRSARSRTCAADSSAHTSRQRAPAPAIAPSACSSSVLLPMPGLAAEQRDRAGDEPAAEHPVELGDARGAGGARRRDRPRRAGRGGAARHRRGRRRRGATGASPRLPHSPHSVHRPSHFGDS